MDRGARFTYKGCQISWHSPCPHWQHNLVHSTVKNKLIIFSGSISRIVIFWKVSDQQWCQDPMRWFSPRILVIVLSTYTGWCFYLVTGTECKVVGTFTLMSCVEMMWSCKHFVTEFTVVWSLHSARNEVLCVPDFSGYCAQWITCAPVGVKPVQVLFWFAHLAHIAPPARDTDP